MEGDVEVKASQNLIVDLSGHVYPVCHTPTCEKKKGTVGK